MKLQGYAAAAIAGFRECGAAIAFIPSRLGKPEGFAQLAAPIIASTHPEGGAIRLDGAPRKAPH